MTYTFDASIENRSVRTIFYSLGICKSYFKWLQRPFRYGWNISCCSQRDGKHFTKLFVKRQLEFSDCYGNSYQRESGASGQPKGACHFTLQAFEGRRTLNLWLVEKVSRHLIFIQSGKSKTNVELFALVLPRLLPAFWLLHLIICVSYNWPSYFDIYTERIQTRFFFRKMCININAAFRTKQPCELKP